MFTPKNAHCSPTGCYDEADAGTLMDRNMNRIHLETFTNDTNTVKVIISWTVAVF